MLIVYTHSRHPRRPDSAKRGFTLVELLVVIGIIVILVGLLFSAMKFARNSSAKARTRAQLESLHGMLSELDAANHLSESPPGWIWYDETTAPTRSHQVSITSAAVTVGNGSYAPDFWRYPFGIPANTSLTPNSPATVDALDAPGDVGSDGLPQQSVQRNASFAVVNTQLAMQMLAAVPANRAAIDKLPIAAKSMPSWTASAPLQPSFQSQAYGGLLKEDGHDQLAASSVTASIYPPGVHVAYQGGFYRAINKSNSTTPPPANLTAWFDESAAPRGVPVLLDGWGNPIIFVPASGLHVKLLNGQSTYLAVDPPAGTATQEWIIISPEGSVSGNGTANPYVVRPGRPFFASAGPDGDFTKGDDNVYSFEN